MKYIIVVTERKNIELKNEELSKVLDGIQYRTAEGKEQLMHMLDGLLSLLDKNQAEGRLQTLPDHSMKLIISVNSDDVVVIKCFPVRHRLPLLSQPDLTDWKLDSEEEESTPREEMLRLLEFGQGDLIINEMEEIKHYLQSVSERMEENEHEMELRFFALDCVINAIRLLLNRVK